AENWFLQAVADAIRTLEANPLVAPIYLGNFRWYRLRRFPYLIYFQPMINSTIYIYAIAHARQRPGLSPGYSAQPKISLEKLHRVAEQFHPVALHRQAQASPLRMLYRQDMAFRVRHQAEDAPGCVADASDVALRAIGVQAIVAQHDLAGLL